MAILDDKVAIVTGSARGIGRATAQLLAAQGRRCWSTTSTAMSPSRPRREIDGETIVFAGDLTKPGSLRRARRSR